MIGVNLRLISRQSAVSHVHSPLKSAIPQSTMTFLADLRWRGLIHQTTDDAGLGAWLAEKPRTVYVGFDPTADSLHVGHLMGLIDAAAVSAGGASADRRRRRRDGHDRRPQRQERRAQSALRGRPRSATSPAWQRRCARFLDFDAGAIRRAAGQQLRLDGAVELSRVPARRRQELSRQRDARQGLGEEPARRGESDGRRA